ncbi:MAG: hypothetical protein ACFB0E_08340 [Leptolyngbyaceae cyanobacterium]
MAWCQWMRQLLAATPISLRHPRARTWFCLMLGYNVIVAGLIWQAVAGDPYAIADDARQHVFWMGRFTDASLFPNDWIADYYQSIAPVGYAWIYRFFAIVGIPPLLLCKLLPPVLIMLTGTISFLTAFELSSLPAAGFAAAALMTQSVGFTATLSSGTAKAFVFGLMLLFIYGWLRRSRWLSWGSIALQGILYPQVVLLSVGLLVLGLVDRRQGKWSWRRDRALWSLTAGGLLIATVVILYYASASSQFGPTVTLEEALTMPEFFRGGRTNYFQNSWLKALLNGRGGLRLDAATTPMTNFLALGLPLMLRRPQRFPLAKGMSRNVDILLKLVAVACFWFVAAHLLLFKLYLPSRYTSRFFFIAAVLAAAIAIVLLLDAVLGWASHQLQSPGAAQRVLSGGLAIGLASALGLLVVLYPLTMSGYPYTSITQGNSPDLYAFVANQPKNSLIAGTAIETNNLPTYSQRSVLVSREVAIPYHMGYYRELRQRAKQLIAAQYSPDPAVVGAFIQQYAVTHWLLEKTDFDISKVGGDRWVQQYQPEAGAATTVLASQQIPFLQKQRDRCRRFEDAQHWLLDAECILAASETAR